MKNFFFLFLILSFSMGCQSTNSEKGQEATQTDLNPPAPGFDEAGSDPRAIALADSVMIAMGGRKNWDETNYLRWNFFGSRNLWWDKKNGRVRIESKRDSAIYLIDLNKETGQVMKKGEVLTQPDSVAHYVKRGKSIWINDSYWLFMPFKLKDSGVTLTYLGKDSIQGGNAAEVLQLTFEGVGDTPQNRYKVYVDPVSHLVVQWSFFSNASDPEPRFTNIWDDYRLYGKILLSGGRGQRQLSDIMVAESLPESVFTSFEPVPDAITPN